MKIAIIGCGYWGSKLLDRFEKALGSESIVVCDIRAIDRNITCSSPIPVYKDYQDALPLVDAVTIATPIGTHYEIAKTCLLAGKHVLVEKPMAKSGREAYELGDIARDRNLVLMTDLTFLYDERVNGIVNPKLLFWGGRFSQTSDENILWTLGPHPISIMVRAMGYPEDVISVRRSFAFLWTIYLYGSRYVTVHLNWGLTLPKTRYVIMDGGALDLTKQGADPLTNVCAEFKKRINEKNTDRDLIGAQVTAVLEWTEKSS